MSYKIIYRSFMYTVRFFRNGKSIPELEAVCCSEKEAKAWAELIVNA